MDILIIVVDVRIYYCCGHHTSASAFADDSDTAAGRVSVNLADGINEALHLTLHTYITVQFVWDLLDTASGTCALCSVQCMLELS